MAVTAPTIALLIFKLFCVTTPPIPVISLNVETPVTFNEDESVAVPETLKVPIISNVVVGAALPRPNLLLVSSQKKLALSCTIVVPLLNNTEPLVNDGKVNLELICVCIELVTPFT